MFIPAHEFKVVDGLVTSLDDDLKQEILIEILISKTMETSEID